MYTFKTSGFDTISSPESAATRSTQGGTSITRSATGFTIRSADWGQPQQPQQAPIGFQPPTPATPATPKGLRCLGSRKEYLRAIEIAAGKVLLAGTDREAIEAIKRGRLGGRKDNMAELAELLRRYEV